MLQRLARNGRRQVCVVAPASRLVFRLGWNEGGIVDEHVHRAESRTAARNRVATSSLDDTSQRTARHCAPRADDLLLDGGESRLVDVADDDVRALPRHAEGDRLAETPAAARDERDPVLSFMTAVMAAAARARAAAVPAPARAAPSPAPAPGSARVRRGSPPLPRSARPPSSAPACRGSRTSTRHSGGTAAARSAGRRRWTRRNSPIARTSSTVPFTPGNERRPHDDAVVREHGAQLAEIAQDQVVRHAGEAAVTLAVQALDVVVDDVEERQQRSRAPASVPCPDVSIAVDRPRRCASCSKARANLPWRSTSPPDSVMPPPERA